MAITEIVVYWIIALGFLFGGAYIVDKVYNSANKWYTWPVFFLSLILSGLGGIATIVAILYWAFQLWTHV